jgi:hypothetical protein
MLCIPDPAYVAFYDFKPVPNHWAKALTQSELKGLEMLKVKIMDCAEHGDGLGSMTSFLLRSIVRLFRERSDKSRERPPKVGLKGFRASEADKFPKDLDVFNY